MLKVIDGKPLLGKHILIGLQAGPVQHELLLMKGEIAEESRMFN